MQMCKYGDNWIYSSSIAATQMELNFLGPPLCIYGVWMGIVFMLNLSDFIIFALF